MTTLVLDVQTARAVFSSGPAPSPHPMDRPPPVEIAARAAEVEAAPQTPASAAAAPDPQPTPSPGPEAANERPPDRPTAQSPAAEPSAAATEKPARQEARKPAKPPASQPQTFELGIETLPHWRLIEPIPVTIAPLADQAFSGTIHDLNMTADGASPNHALLLLKEKIENLYKELDSKTKLDQTQKKQLAFLRFHISNPVFPSKRPRF